MNPLYDNTETQFKDWPVGVQNEFFQATAMRGEDWQAFDASYKRWSNGFRYCPSFNPNHIYRLARPEPKPLVVPWDALEDAVVCVAVDDGGNLQAAIDDIEDCVGGYWRFPRSHMVTPYVNLLKFERGNLPWQETKTWRPGHEPKEEG